MSNIKETAVEVTNLHKEFILSQAKNSTFKQTVVNIVKKNKKVTQKVLDGVSFEVKKGDFFGIVGRNGSGKSTLLKLISGIYTPTSGKIILNGGLTPFIELGVGFNPELSGRDNVFLNGALLGFNRKQMDAMYNDIVAFAELEPFMGQKLKNYSSGMQVRLAFSIAIKAKNEILIFDEVLAVGDEAFKRKCMDVFEKYKAEGQTVILVTHDMSTVRKFCNRVILLKDGKIIKEGNPQEVADEYSKLNQQQIDRETVDTNEISNKMNLSVELSSAKNRDTPKVSFLVGESILVNVLWDKSVTADIVMLDLFKQSGEHITNFKTIRDKISCNKVNKVNNISLGFEAMLTPGKYSFIISLRNKKDDEIESAYGVGSFTVIDNWSLVKLAWSGLVPIAHSWKE